MTPGELEAIRERTEDDEYYSGVKHRFDAAALLAEVDRLRAEVVRLGRELTARGRPDLVEQTPDPDDDGVLDDLANDYRGVDDTAQGRGDL